MDIDWHARGRSTDLLKRRNHNVRPIVDGQHDIGDTGSGQSFHLMQDHWTVRKFDQWFRKRESLMGVRILWPYVQSTMSHRAVVATGLDREGAVPGVVVGYQTLPRE